MISFRKKQTNDKWVKIWTSNLDLDSGWWVIDIDIKINDIVFPGFTDEFKEAFKKEQVWEQLQK